MRSSNLSAATDELSGGGCLGTKIQAAHGGIHARRICQFNKEARAFKAAIRSGTATAQVMRIRHSLTIYEIEATRVGLDSRVSSAYKINVTMLDISARQFRA
jgi:hypothetical protein